MQSFAAVVTTGIYCRPGCSARPRADNVRTFPIAAAAEAAGYRACLRCRPYRLPPVPLKVEPEIVCRAVRLILDGALDDNTETTLAGRLGMSARHLRRLFTTHLGVTPDGLARSARAHFARRLLDEADLTVTEVAYAAGFGSLRQFNRVCQDVFRASPSALRAKRRRSDRLAADGGLALRLTYHGRLDWPAMVGCLAQTATRGVESVGDDAYRRTVLVDGDPGELELMPGGEDHLLLRAHLPHWDELLHIVRRARHIASLDSDPADGVRQLGHDPVIGPLVRARPGVRVPGTWDVFETGVRALIARHGTPSTTRALVARLVERYGRPVAGLGELGLTHLFPDPRTVSTSDLTGIGIRPATAAAVRAFAAATVDNSDRFDRSIGLHQIIAKVGAISGVGAQTAHYVALRLGEQDAFPLSDHQLVRHLSTHDGPTRDTGVVLSDRWRPWRALAVAHLWAAGHLPEGGPEGRRTTTVSSRDDVSC